MIVPSPGGSQKRCMKRAQNWPLLNEPGTVFRYANNDTLAAVQAIEETFEANPPFCEELMEATVDHFEVVYN